MAMIRTNNFVFVCFFCCLNHQSKIGKLRGLCPKGKYTLMFVMSLLLLYLETLGNRCAQLKSPSLLSHFPPIYLGFWHQNNPPKNTNHMLTLIHCHYCCNINFTLFHKVIRYTNSLLSRIHANTTELLNTKCTLVAAGVILGRLKCMFLRKGPILTCPLVLTRLILTPFPLPSRPPHSSPLGPTCQL